MINIPEGGEPYIHDICDRCGTEKPKGIRYIRGGQVLFKCDSCGRNGFIGYLEEVHKKQLTGKLNHERATENRDRFWNENQQKQKDDFKQLSKIPGTAPETVWNIDYATRRWNFDKPSQTT